MGAVELHHVLIFARRIAGLFLKGEAEARVADAEIGGECFEIPAFEVLWRYLLCSPLTCVGDGEAGFAHVFFDQ